MSSQAHEIAPLENETLGIVTFASPNDPDGVCSNGTTPAYWGPHADGACSNGTTTHSGPLSALDLLNAWGAIPGPDLRNRWSFYKARRLAIRGTAVHRGWCAAGRAAARCPSPTACVVYAYPREPAGALTAWSANAPPVPLSA